MCILCTEGRIIVHHLNETYPDRAARFGPPLPRPSKLPPYTADSRPTWEELGLTGQMVSMALPEIGNEEGCTPYVAKPFEFPEIWIALVRRGGCSFVEKVRAMQELNASAVIVGDNVTAPLLVEMKALANETDIMISSVFIFNWEYHALKFRAIRLYGISKQFLKVTLVRNDVWFYQDWFDVLLAIMIGSIAFLTAGVLFLWIYRNAARRNAVDEEVMTAPEDLVNNLPLRTYTKPEPHSDEHRTCVICLDEFENGDQLRVLPCNHKFHNECVDPWLTGRNRSCPCCKQDICSNQTMVSNESLSENPSQTSLALPSSSHEDEKLPLIDSRS
jgi:hypothetical protein